MRNPMTDFLVIKDQISQIIEKETKTELFYELTRSLSEVENLILLGNTNDSNFTEKLSQLIVDSISYLSTFYKIDDLYDFLDSRKHWGLIQEDDTMYDTYKSLVIPFYELRMEISQNILKKHKGFRVKPLFLLSKFLIYKEQEFLAEQNNPIPNYPELISE